MIKIKNISNKVIGVPDGKGGNAAVLPDQVVEVGDENMASLTLYKDLGLIAISKKSLAEKKDDEFEEEDADLAAGSSENGPESAPAEAAKEEPVKAAKRGRAAKK